jgi:hypothetical protein
MERLEEMQPLRVQMDSVDSEGLGDGDGDGFRGAADDDDDRRRRRWLCVIGTAAAMLLLAMASLVVGLLWAEHVQAARHDRQTGPPKSRHVVALCPLCPLCPLQRPGPWLAS